MRILVDQSGYDLLNIGDVAMLQSCVTRLRGQWPAAEIMVIATAPERLAAYCPGTIAIGRTFADLPVFRMVPRKARLALEQAWKIAGPYLARQHGRPLRTGPGPRSRRYGRPIWWWPAAVVTSPTPGGGMGAGC